MFEFQSGVQWVCVNWKNIHEVENSAFYVMRDLFIVRLSLLLILLAKQGQVLVVYRFF